MATYKKRHVNTVTFISNLNCCCSTPPCDVPWKLAPHRVCIRISNYRFPSVNYWSCHLEETHCINRLKASHTMSDVSPLGGKKLFIALVQSSHHHLFSSGCRNLSLSKKTHLNYSFRNVRLVI